MEKKTKTRGITFSVKLSEEDLAGNSLIKPYIENMDISEKKEIVLKMVNEGISKKLAAASDDVLKALFSGSKLNEDVEEQVTPIVSQMGKTE